MDTKNPELIVQLDQARLPIELRLAESLKRGYAFPYSAGLFSPERPEISLRRPSGLYDDTVRPWHVTANGDDTVTVNEGTILVPNYRGTDDEDRAPIIYEPVTFAGDDDLQITAAGYLYARLEYPAILSGLQISWLDGSGLSPGFGAGLSIRNADAISVIFSSSAPATISPANTYTHWPIAQVDLQDGVASVTKQILTHNLTHDLVYIHVSSSP